MHAHLMGNSLIHTHMTSAQTTLFAAGINHAYIWMAAINALAIIPSLLIGKRVEEHAPLSKIELSDDAI
jgi:hypothetical protein